MNRWWRGKWCRGIGLSYEDNWKALQKVNNKSKVVNLALSFYFDAKKMLKKKEEDFIFNELQHYEETGEAYDFDETFKN